MAGVLSTSFIYNRSRDVYVMYTHKNTTCSLIKKIYYTPQECARNSNGRPGGVHGLHHDLILDGLLPQNNPLAGNNGNNNNNYLDSLAGLAPIALAMYCFNSAPKLTMVTLTTLLLFIIGSDSD
ncbi:hypothetical protein EKK58_01840 [Candidatus Dependentiae bacterium]|nr:MAG: hypothetical protein EKK58_01840 [Candidatus Dependentiae bacterium]